MVTEIKSLNKNPDFGLSWIDSWRQRTLGLILLSGSGLY